MQHSNRFFSLFPPPRFLEMPAVGIDISDRSIRFAELKHGKGAFVLGKFGEKFISPGIVVGGEIRKHEELRRILDDLRKEFGFLYVRVSLPEQLGYSLKIKVPKVAREDLYESIELQLGDHVPLSPREAVFDYELVTCGATPDDSFYKVGLSVMPKEIIQSYVSLFERTGLTPLSFEFEAHAIARSVVRAGDCGTFLLLDIGATRTGFAIISRGIITFTSTINVGGYSLTESAAKVLGVSFKEAERRKEERGLLDGKEDLLYQVLIARLSVLRDEILKHYAYVRTHENIIEKGSAVEMIVLCGGEANVPGFPNYLATTLETDVEIANPWVNINSLTEYIPEITSNHALRYATALGLTLNTVS